MAETLLTRQHDGQTITAAVGTTLVVQLPESPTTGYTWVQAAAGSALALTDADFSLPPQAGLGAGGLRTLRFELRQSGLHPLQLLLMRPWEAADAAIDRFGVTVQADPA